MAQHYQARILGESGGVVTVGIGFGDPAQNDVLVPEATQALAALALKGGRGIRFHGPASVPVAMALSHAVSHLYEFVACFDPKLNRYVVVVSHAPSPRPGELLPVG